MPDTLTPNLSLVKPGIDESNDTWGNKYNDNMDKIDSALMSAGGGLVGKLSYEVSGSGDPVVGTRGAWATYPLGTKRYDSSGFISVTSNVFSVPFDAFVDWMIMVYFRNSVDGTERSILYSRLFDVDGSAPVMSGVYDAVFIRSGVNGEFSLKSRGSSKILAGKNYRIEYAALCSATTSVLMSPPYSASFPNDRVSSNIVIRR